MAAAGLVSGIVVEHLSEVVKFCPVNACLSVGPQMRKTLRYRQRPSSELMALSPSEDDDDAIVPEAKTPLLRTKSGPPSLPPPFDMERRASKHTRERSVRT